MKRFFACICLVLFLSGCADTDEEMQRAMALRVKAQSCALEFTAVITADYGDRTYAFTMDCQADQTGKLTFQVIQPQSIAGISGSVGQNSGKLTFDDHVLAFDILADDLISPVSGPWVLVKALRSGYLTSCGSEVDSLRIAIDDSYENDALHLDIWLDDGDLPKQCDILWQGRRLLSIEVQNFRFL